MKRFGKFVCVLTLVLAAKSVAAQEIAGSIRGTVVDGSGGTVSGVKVTATQSETGLKRSTMSDAQGTYILVELPVGHYFVEAEAQGFKKYIQGGISLDVNQTAAVTIRLAVGLPTQEVQVNTNAPLVEPTVTSLGKAVEERDVLDLPLNGRNFSQLGVLQPGSRPNHAGVGGSGRDR
jgi:Carboxypeptidase regulatory-like domain